MSFATARFSRTAAWRVSLPGTLAFACGTLLVFLYLHHYFANDIQRRTDAWLTGELQTLRDVAIRTPKDRLYSRVVSETAEMASHEIPSRTPGSQRPGEPNQAVFFLQTPTKDSPALWVGAGNPDAILSALSQDRFAVDVPVDIRLAGHRSPFRVAVAPMPDGSRIYLGVSEQDERHTLHRLRIRFLILWVISVLLGFCIIFWVTRRMLGAVRKINDAASHIGDENLGQRVPESGGHDEMAQLASTLNRMLDRIEKSMYQLHTITNALAHDLRSPLTAIRARLEIALGDGDGPPHTDSVARAIDEIDRLTEVLDQSLDVAEAHAGALQIHPRLIELDALIRAMSELYQPSMHEKGIHLDLRIHSPVEIWGDPALLQRAITNLFDNELKHLPGSKTMMLSLSTEGDAAVLLIEDDGPGIPADIVSDVFKPRVKGHTSGGFGLGLSFVQAVVLAHNGSVNAENREPSGIRVTIRLPLHGAPQSTGASAGSLATAGEARNSL
ncbi:MAG TPA: HAMP domain-containing sensor histidine kinase [Candidatus Aquilonibacter sp.]|nr:HAMP domain-containing sensor histidine kinase [Candidatus Aquilonibacter sp.]